MKKIKLICDCRESFPTNSSVGHHNDHQSQDNIKMIQETIITLGYDCEIYGGVNELINQYNKTDKIDKNAYYLNLSDGLTQEYSRVQIPIMCDLLHLKYSGGNAFAVALATNKYYAKLAAKKIGIPVPKSILITPEYNTEELRFNDITYPVIIKPNTKGSSVGITNKSVCFSYSEMIEHLNTMIPNFEEILIEEYIPGYDVTCFIIGNKGCILLNEPVVAVHENIVFNEREVMSIDDYAQKTNTYIPSINIIKEETIETVKQFTEQIFVNFQTYDFSRLDYRVTVDGNIYFLEINTIPGIRPNNQIGAICKQKSITFKEFINLMVQAFIDRIDKTYD